MSERRWPLYRKGGESGIQRLRGRGSRDPTAIVPAPCRPLERAVPVSCLRAGIPTQHRHGGRVVPGTSMGQVVSCRSWIVFKRAVSVLAQRG
jgi:hypothetical protein